MQQKILSLEKVTKQYGAKKAIDDVSFSVERGEIFGFLGPNGAGKTTTIRTILGSLQATSGKVELFGASSRSAQIHRRIGYLSGDMALEDDLTGKQFLQYIANAYGGGFTAQTNKLATFLEADLNVKIRNYSRGNRQKIGLIAALLHEPDLLILDEPTSGFDPLVQEKFIELIRDFKAGGGTVFMSSHILSEVQQLCDRIAFIRDGAIVGVKTVDELTTTATKHITVKASPKTIKIIGNSYALVAGLEVLEQQHASLKLSYTGEPKTLLAFLAGYELIDVLIQEPDLEEIFMTYYEPQQGAAYV